MDDAASAVATIFRNTPMTSMELGSLLVEHGPDFVARTIREMARRGDLSGYVALKNAFFESGDWELRMFAPSDPYTEKLAFVAVVLMHWGEPWDSVQSTFIRPIERSLRRRGISKNASRNAAYWWLRRGLSYRTYYLEALVPLRDASHSEDWRNYVATLPDERLKHEFTSYSWATRFERMHFLLLSRGVVMSVLDRRSVSPIEGRKTALLRILRSIRRTLRRKCDVDVDKWVSVKDPRFLGPRSRHVVEAWGVPGAWE